MDESHNDQPKGGNAAVTSPFTQEMTPLYRSIAEPGEPTLTADDHTQDLGAVAQLPDDELATQRFGQRMLITGIILAGGTAISTLAAWIASGVEAWENSTGVLFAALTIMSSIATSAALIVVGGLERFQRVVRARQRAAATDIRRMRALVERTAVDTEEKYRNLVGIVSPLPGRLSAAEDGLQALIDVLPDEIRRQYWAGFNDAVREGFVVPTGTDGLGKRRHLGIVHHEGDDGSSD